MGLRRCTHALCGSARACQAIRPRAVATSVAAFCFAASLLYILLVQLASTDTTAAISDLFDLSRYLRLDDNRPALDEIQSKEKLKIAALWGNASEDDDEIGVCDSSKTGDVGARADFESDSGAFSSYYHVGCLGHPNSEDVLQTFTSASMTIAACLTFCFSFNYGLLAKGKTCMCQDKMGAGEVLTNEKCSLACSGNASESCGGDAGASVYHLRSPDGAHDWTGWMNPPQQKKDSEYSVRYRGCILNSEIRTCNATIEKRWGESATIGAAAFSYFIGCFAFGSAPTEMKVNLDGRVRANSCLVGCRGIGMTFALFDSVKGCRCAHTLGISRAIGSCDGVYGVGVYHTSSSAGNGSRVALKFDAKPQQRKVQLAAYYRSGSTFVSELLDRHPGALYIYEPDSIFGLAWRGSKQQLAYVHEDFYRAFARYLECDVYRLPRRWISLNTFWPPMLERAYKYFKYFGCTQALSAEACLPFFQAHCEAASIIAVKTIRVMASSAMLEFVRHNEEVIVVHLMRDPRGILSSRKSLGLSITGSRARALCWHLGTNRNLVNKMAQEGYAAYNINYEDVAETPIAAAEFVYEDILHLNMSASMRERLLSITGRQKDERSRAAAKAHFAFSTHRQSSLKSLNKWKAVLTYTEQRTIMHTCQALL